MNRCNKMLARLTLAVCAALACLLFTFPIAAVAQGIESAADLQALMVMGCDFGQGVLIAPLMPQERFLELLRRRVSMARPQAQSGLADVVAVVPASGDANGRVA
jgi:EAL domain-containing protein (putative c-di-GMP-specific phosphodiesterase class I)